MKLVLIFGDASVGKMTVGQELTKMTDLRLFHNHMTIEPVLEIFGEFNGAAINRMREVILEEFSKTDNYGLIFTYMWAFDQPSDWKYIEHYVKSSKYITPMFSTLSWLRLKKFAYSEITLKTD